MHGSPSGEEWAECVLSDLILTKMTVVTPRRVASYVSGLSKSNSAVCSCGCCSLHALRVSAPFAAARTVNEPVGKRSYSKQSSRGKVSRPDMGGYAGEWLGI